ncbi:MAG: ATP-binding cassette domain-containing protein [Planctomycetes bacterium]|nr:ATP-binding cassette domain-containing protein [Planctomycetota bacterium]
MTESAIVLENVTKRFGSFTAVQDMNLVIPKGLVYGFLGPNGAGKTTTIRMILSIFEPSEGRIEILGHKSAIEVRERIGYLPEEKGLYKKMKVWAMIAYFGALKGMTRANARARALELLETYGLGKFSNYKCDALSKGMQQKVQLLASIVHNPELVILDEPFSGLDPVNQEVMEGAIADLKKNGQTVIFSTHIMDHAERLCDRILLIAGGRKILDGTLAEAKKSIPRRMRIETEGSADILRRVPGVKELNPIGGETSAHKYELMLEDDADPDSILKACFQNNIMLRSFDRSDPSLREVFMTLVKAQGAEAITQ